MSPELRRGFDDIAATVRKGGTAQTELGAIAPEHPVWLEFARGMGPMMKMPAQMLADLIPLEGAPKVLDISASHGVWGMAFAQKHPRAQLVALDWAPVLELTRENAERAGLRDRFSTIAGNAFEVELGSDYDVVLVPNFLHHFNRAGLCALSEEGARGFAGRRTGGDRGVRAESRPRLAAGGRQL